MTQRHIIAVLTNPVAQREDEYNRWYDDRHIPDVLTIPGVISAQRFRLSPAQRMDPPHPYQYFSLYEIETDDLPGLIEEMRRRGGTQMMPISDALDPERMTLFFTPITPRIVAQTE